MKIPQDVEIETVFKVIQPLTPLAGGHGYNGVILRCKDDGRIQCHICGKWCHSLGRHSCAAHEIPAKEYRYKFGLPLGYPLCSQKVSAARHKTAMDHDLGSNLAQYRSKNKDWQKRANTKNRKKRVRYGLTSASFQNKKGACPEQIERRFHIVCDQVGKEASLWDIRRHDPPLDDIIRRRFGSFNKFKSANGYTPVNVVSEWTEDKVIAGLRRYATTHARVPSSLDIRGKAKHGYPGYNSVLRLFGSWNRALSAAGFERRSM